VNQLLDIDSHSPLLVLLLMFGAVSLASSLAIVFGLTAWTLWRGMRRCEQKLKRLAETLFLLAVLLPVAAGASAQFITREMEGDYRRMIPDLELANEPRLKFYSEHEQPRVYQFQLNHTGVMSFYFARYNISMAKREGERYGNANLEFPWGAPGGCHRCQNVESFKFLLLPLDDQGQQKPIVWHERRAGDEMHVPSLGYGWVYPLGTIVGEVLMMRSPSGQLFTFETRIRERAQRHWEPRVLRPFPTAEQFVGAIKLRGDYHQRADLQNLVAHLESDAPLPTAELASEHPDRQAFYQEAEVDELPAIADEQTVNELLTTYLFDDATGQVWRGKRCYAPTTKAAWHIVPQNYDGGFIEASTQSCARCHDSVGRHARDFDRGRDWYGHVRGGDKIFSFTPIDFACVDPTHWGRPARMLDIPGLVEQFDGSKHSREDYREIHE
jgi:hypothetical protein